MWRGSGRIESACIGVGGLVRLVELELWEIMVVDDGDSSKESSTPLFSELSSFLCCLACLGVAQCCLFV